MKQTTRLSEYLSCYPMHFPFSLFFFIFSVKPHQIHHIERQINHSGVCLYLSLYLENLTELFRHLLFGSAYSRMVGNTNCVAPFHVRLWICQGKLCQLVLSSVWLAEKAVSQQGQRATLGCQHTWAHRQPSKHQAQSALCFAPHRD